MTRLLALALGALAATLSAQDPSTKPAPAKPVVVTDVKAAEEKQKGDAAQNPPQEKSTQDVLNPLAELQAELERAKIELATTKKLAAEGGLPTVVRPFFTTRALEARSVQVTIKPAEPTVPVDVAAPATGSVRLMTADEKASLGEEVVALADSQPIKRSEVEEMAKYYGSNPGDQSEDDLKRQALRALIVQKASLAAFKDKAPAAQAKMAEIEKELAGGADFAELAKKHSQCPSAAQGGDLGFFGRGGMDATFEKTSFTLKMGSVSPAIQSAFGYHLIKATGFKKGATPGEDQVQASHILVMFDSDQQVVRTAMMNAMNGRCALAFRDEDWQKLNPFAATGR